MYFLPITARFLVFFMIIPCRQGIPIRGILAVAFSLLAYSRKYQALSIEELFFQSTVPAAFYLEVAIEAVTGAAYALPVLAACTLCRIFLAAVDQYCTGHELQFLSAVNGSGTASMAYLFDNLIAPILVINGTCLGWIRQLFQIESNPANEINFIFMMYGKLFSVLILATGMLLMLEIIFSLFKTKTGITLSGELYLIKVSLVALSLIDFVL